MKKDDMNSIPVQVDPCYRLADLLLARVYRPPGGRELANPTLRRTSGRGAAKSADKRAS